MYYISVIIYILFKIGYGKVRYCPMSMLTFTGKQGNDGLYLSCYIHTCTIQDKQCQGICLVTFVVWKVSSV